MGIAVHLNRPLVRSALVAGLALTANAWAANALPKLHVDAARVTVAGLSSGAYMATQAQVAYPDVFHGVAMVAGGPYGCAGGKLETALGSCMKGTPLPDAKALAGVAKERAGRGEIGPLAELAKARVYALHGAQDGLVAPSVAAASASFYTALGMQVVDDGKRPFAHNLPIAAKGDDCDKSVSPYLGHCGFDAAGEIFSQLYGKPVHKVGDAGGHLLTFDQDALRVDGVDALLGSKGYVYVPAACAAGKPCGVMVALHGCKQNVDSVGEAFVKDAGFNRWADAYDVAVVYPQTRASMAPLNPQACWDWWGYSGTEYDTRKGVQLRWLVNALGALGVPAPK